MLCAVSAAMTLSGIVIESVGTVIVGAGAAAAAVSAAGVAALFSPHAPRTNIAAAATTKYFDIGTPRRFF
jgi:hypothetical protein